MLDKLGSTLSDYARLAEARKWEPLGQLKGKKEAPWLLAYGHAPELERYKPRLAFHRGNAPVARMTTNNYFEILLEDPGTQITGMATILSNFLDEGDYEPISLGFLWKFILWFGGGSLTDATLWLRRKPLTFASGSVGASRDLFYGVARQTKHGGLLTIVESFDASFSGFAMGGSTLQFNWLSLTLESGRKMAELLADFEPPAGSQLTKS